jgi:hypothetical protein
MGEFISYLSEALREKLLHLLHRQRKIKTSLFSSLEDDQELAPLDELGSESDISEEDTSS